MTKEIDGVKFTVTPFQAVEALKLKSYLLRKFGPSIGQALGTMNGLPKTGRIGDLKVDGNALSLAIEKLMEQIGEEDFIALIKRMLRNVQAVLTKDGKAITIVFTENNFDASMDIVFSGRLFSVYPVMGLVLETNYPDFFGKLVPGIGQRIQKTFYSAPEEPEQKNASGKSEM